MLIVDDDPEVGAVVGDILAGAGYSVGVAQNGQEALAALSSEDTLTPALIVLDLNMPDTNGLDLLPILRQAVTRPIPVVILTGHAEMETQARRDAHGGAGIPHQARPRAQAGRRGGRRARRFSLRRLAAPALAQAGGRVSPAH